MFELDSVEFEGCWRIKKGLEAPVHTHPCYELIYFLEGKGHINTQGMTFHPRLYNLVLFPPNIEHSEITDRLYPDEIIMIGANVRTRFKLLKPFQVTDWNGNIRWLFEHIYEEHTSEENNCREIIHAYLKAAFVLIERFCESGRPDYPDLLNWTLQYINDHYSDDINVNMLAAMVFVSSFHLIRTFRRNMNTTPLQYLSNVRIEAAKRFLASGNMPVGDVAVQVGFKDFRYFSRVFKKITGSTPSNFKKQCKDSKI